MSQLINTKSITDRRVSRLLPLITIRYNFEKQFGNDRDLWLRCIKEVMGSKLTIEQSIVADEIEF